VKRWNHYVCQECGAVTIAKHEDEGVTPFIIRCHAKDTFGIGGIRAHGCNGQAQSQFFEVSQSDDQKPHVTFFRPSDAMEAIMEINKLPEWHRAWYLDHYQKGGSLMREEAEEVPA